MQDHLSGMWGSQMSPGMGGAAMFIGYMCVQLTHIVLGHPSLPL